MDQKFRLSLSSYAYSRVHITKATLVELSGKFEVEDGKGRERDEVLAKLNIDTFLIIPPKHLVNKKMGHYFFMQRNFGRNSGFKSISAETEIRVFRLKLFELLRLCFASAER